MAFIINWLAALGALVILGLFYNDAVLLNPGVAVLISLTAVVFIALAHVLRVSAQKLVPLNNITATISLILVMIVIGSGIYFAVPQISEFTYTGQYAALVWIFLLDAIILIESILAFRSVKHPRLEGKLQSHHV